MEENGQVVGYNTGVKGQLHVNQFDTCVEQHTPRSIDPAVE